MTAVSMCGLDLSFMKNSPLPKVKKKPGRPIASKRSDLPCPMVYSDIKEFRSPIDGSLISSRASLRDHEQRHGVKQNGDMKKGEIVANENKRIAKTRAAAKAKTEWVNPVR